MDKNIIDALVKFGLITNIGVDADMFKDVDELIERGIITIPGAKDALTRIIGEINPVDEKPVVEEPVVVEEVKEETKVEEPVVETKTTSKRTKKTE